MCIICLNLQIPPNIDSIECRGCSKLKEVKLSIPVFKISFYECNNLRSIDIEGVHTISVTRCKNINKISIRDGHEINLFQLRKLKELDLSSFYGYINCERCPELVRINANNFYLTSITCMNCNKLLQIPNSNLEYINRCKWLEHDYGPVFRIMKILINRKMIRRKEKIKKELTKHLHVSISILISEYVFFGI